MNISGMPAEEKLAHLLVDAAVWAPSVLNTQPWWFSTRAGRVTLHADTDRRLEATDPEGREMLISCGAALYTLRLAVRHLGHRPEVELRSDPERPGLIADVVIGPAQPPSDEEGRLFEQIKRRRTHRGGFRPGVLPVGLLQALRAQASAERASLRIVADPRARTALGALSEAAEQVHRMDPSYVAEAALWAPPPGSERPNGVHAEAYPRESAHTDPYFAERDFARGQGWGLSAGDRGQAAGVVALLMTVEDRRDDWLRAGQALQRVLLRATEDEVSAAFHTQALEVPELREFIRTRFCDGAYPQMLMRLGVAQGDTGGVRRPSDDIVIDEL